MAFKLVYPCCCLGISASAIEYVHESSKIFLKDISMPAAERKIVVQIYDRSKELRDELTHTYRNWPTNTKGRFKLIQKLLKRFDNEVKKSIGGYTVAITLLLPSRIISDMMFNAQIPKRFEPILDDHLTKLGELFDLFEMSDLENHDETLTAVETVMDIWSNIMPYKPGEGYR